MRHLREFVEAVYSSRFDCQGHGSLLLVEITVKLRGEVLLTTQYVDEICCEILQMIEVRHVPWIDSCSL